MFHVKQSHILCNSSRGSRTTVTWQILPSSFGKLNVPSALCVAMRLNAASRGVNCPFILSKTVPMTQVTSNSARGSTAHLSSIAVLLGIVQPFFGLSEHDYSQPKL